MRIIAVTAALFILGSVELVLGAGMVILPQPSPVIGQPDVIFELGTTQSFVPDQDANGESRISPVLVYHDSVKTNFFNLIWPDNNTGWPAAALAFPSARSARGIYCFTDGGQNTGAQSTITKAYVKFHEFGQIALSVQDFHLERVISDIRPQLSIAGASSFSYGGLCGFSSFSILSKGIPRPRIQPSY